MIAARRRRETPRDLEHRCDHQIAAAFFRREQARKGAGFKFELPAKAREAQS